MVRKAPQKYKPPPPGIEPPPLPVIAKIGLSKNENQKVEGWIRSKEIGLRE